MFYPEHIFINRIIKLPLERYRKYKRKQGKNTPNQKGTSETSEPVSKHQRQSNKKKKKNTVYSTERNLLLMFSLTSGVRTRKLYMTRNETIYKTLKQCENSENHIIIQKVPPEKRTSDQNDCTESSPNVN